MCFEKRADDLAKYHTAMLNYFRSFSIVANQQLLLSNALQHIQI